MHPCSFPAASGCSSRSCMKKRLLQENVLFFLQQSLPVLFSWAINQMPCSCDVTVMPSSCDITVMPQTGCGISSAGPAAATARAGA